MWGCRYLTAQGLTLEDVSTRLSLFGENSVDVKPPTFWHHLGERLTSPFVVFSIFNQVCLACHVPCSFWRNRHFEHHPHPLNVLYHCNVFCLCFRGMDVRRNPLSSLCLTAVPASALRLPGGRRRYLSCAFEGEWGVISDPRRTITPLCCLCVACSTKALCVDTAVGAR